MFFFKLYKILLTDDRHKFNSNIFFSHYLLFFYIKKGYYREWKKTRRETKRKERIDLSRKRPVRGHGYMKECGWLFYVFYFYVERKRNTNVSNKKKWVKIKKNYCKSYILVDTYYNLTFLSINENKEKKTNLSNNHTNLIVLLQTTCCVLSVLVNAMHTQRIY